MMLTRVLTSAALMATLISIMPLGATNYNYTLFPNIAANTAGNYNNSAPGWGTGSWQSPGVGAKQEVYLPFASLFPYAVTIADLGSISYYTNKSTNSTDVDWSFIFYTAKTGVNDHSFYHDRLNSEPYLTGTPSVTQDTWHQWSSNDSSNAMRFYDANNNGGIFGTYTDPTLALLQAGPITWSGSGTTDNYATQTLLTLSLQTGSAWNVGFLGLVDGITVTLKSGETAYINLESVTPEPATYIMIGAGIGLLALFRRR